MSPIHPPAQAESITRFRHAQDKKWPGITREIASGQKQTHWMWYVFPQLRVFAKSETAHYYGIADKAEALAYLDDEVLRVRLATATMGILKQRRLMFTDVDQRKLHRCMTLFGELVKDRTLPDAVLTKFFAGEQHQLTLDVLAGKQVEASWKPGQDCGPKTWRPGSWSAQGRVEAAGHWGRQVRRARRAVEVAGQRQLYADSEPMSHREIESYLRSLNLPADVVDRITDRWMDDQNRANQQGWDSRGDESYG